ANLFACCFTVPVSPVFYSRLERRVISRENEAVNRHVTHHFLERTSFSLFRQNTTYTYIHDNGERCTRSELLLNVVYKNSPDPRGTYLPTRSIFILKLVYVTGLTTDYLSAPAQFLVLC
ncbi:unnamed protein product, partial [Sphacelaria rigidula]